MTRPSGTNKLNNVALRAAAAQYPEEGTPRDVEMWTPAGGIRRDLPASKIPLTDVVDAANFRNQRGVWAVRPAVSRVGDAVTDPVISVGLFTNKQDSQFVHMCTTRGMFKLTGDTWQALTGPTLTASVYSEYSFAAWNGKLVYCNGSDQVGEVNYLTSTYAAIAGAPTGRVVMTFAGRLVVGGVVNFPERVQWCAKNDNTDWVGTGSGYEDMLSSSGGVVDTVRAMFPIADYKAIIIRTYSVWVMQTTGLVDTPFTFTKIWDLSGVVAGSSLVLTPAGVVGVMQDDVYLITETTAPQKIGTAVRSLIHPSTNIRHCKGAYDIYNDEYVLNIPQTSGSIVWRYNFALQRWTKDTYNHRTIQVGFSLSRDVDSIGDLEGLIVNLEGTVGELGVHGFRNGMFFATGIAGQYVLYETAGEEADQLPTTGSDDEPIEAYLTSAMLTSQVQLYKLHLIETIVMYESEQALQLLLSYSSNGQDWTLLTQANVAAAEIASPARFSVPLQRAKLQLKLSCLDAACLRVLSVFPRVSQGGKIAH